MAKPAIIEILKRTESGEYRSLKEWDIKLIPGAVREKLKKSKLEKTLDFSNPVNTDESLADTFFKAGYELALEIGMLCETTDRIVMVTEEELADAI